MSVVKIQDGRYTAEDLYQWDLNQTVYVYGLSLAVIPEIHFVSAGMSRAIVRQSAMDDSGVISCDIPNSCLQTAGKMAVYVCTYSGDTFETLYKFEILVKARTKPADYVLIDDPEVYSFNALENAVVNLQSDYDEVDAKHAEAINNLKQSANIYAQTSVLIEAYKTLLDAYGEDVEAYTAAVEGYTAAVEEYRQATLNRLSAVTGAVAGNFAGLNADGTLNDSGKNPDSFTAANNNLIQYVNSVFSTLGGTTLNLEGAKIEAGTYTGNGVNSRSITLSFTPKMFIVTHDRSNTNYYKDALLVLTDGAGFGIDIDIDGYTEYFRFELPYFRSATMSDNVVSWSGYSHRLLVGSSGVTSESGYDPAGILNYDRYVYRYVAIG